MEALIVLCVALAVSGHPHGNPESPLVKGVHESLPAPFRMLQLPSYAAPQVIRIEQPQHPYTTQPPVVREQLPVAHAQPPRMPEESHYAADCPIFVNPIRVSFGEHVTGAHTHGPGHITPPIPGSSLKAIAPQQYSAGAKTAESSKMIVPDMHRPSMAVAHELGTARQTVPSAMPYGKAPSYGTAMATNLIHAAEPQKSSLSIAKVAERIPARMGYGTEKIYQPGHVMEAAKPHIPILRLEQEIVDGHRHSFDFDAANGIHHDDRTTVEHIPGGPGERDRTIVRKTGSYSYIAPDGQHIKMTYVADENGYRVQGTHLPTPPPIPEAITRSLDEIMRARGHL